MQIAKRGFGLGEDGIGRRWDAVFFQKILGKDLGTLKHGRGRARPEAVQPGVLEGVDNTRDQRRFRPDDREPDLFPRGKGRERRSILRADGDIFNAGFLRRAGVARRDIDEFNPPRFCGLPGQRMFAPAAADYEYFHGGFNGSMQEMAHAGAHHGHLMLIGRGDHFRIAHGTAIDISLFAWFVRRYETENQALLILCFIGIIVTTATILIINRNVFKFLDRLREL